MPTPQSIALQSKLQKIRREAEERDARRRAAERTLSYLDVGTIPISIEAVKVIDEKTAKLSQVAAVQLKNKDLALAAYDPNLPETAKVIHDLAQHYTVKVFVVSRSALSEIWKTYQFVVPEAERITGDIVIDQQKLDALTSKYKSFSDFTAEIAKVDYSKFSTTEIFQMILAGALASGASDIHIEAQETTARVRFRVDGLLHDAIPAMPHKNYMSIITRIKLLSGLKINIRDQAQDGRFTIKLPEKETEMRVSLIPSEFGETVVMRILDPTSISVELPQLGLRSDDLEIVEEELGKPNGLILNTGPTGSGKTTTLYAFLRHVLVPEVKIITVEDPIEYRIQGIEQTQVDPQAGYTFASGLRSILRQDPDVILVGEIRDQETSDIALQAALTGHLVFSTLHTNSAIGAVPRLVDLGVKTSTIGPALSLMIAQRLVRKLCAVCRRAVPLTPELQEKVKVFIEKLPARVDRVPYEVFLRSAIGDSQSASEAVLYEKVGCSVCNGFGYKGRVGIFEFLRCDEKLQEAILSSASQLALQKLAREQQMVTMQQDGILKALLGVTTLDEVKDATGTLVW